MQEINLHYKDENQTAKDIIQSSDPIITTEVDVVELLFQLSESEYDRITPLDGEQEYVLAIGEEEFSIIVDKSNPTEPIRFTNIEHLSKLNEEDYLTMRLYLNQDSENILWEYAFRTSGIKLITSDNDGSRRNKSFLLCNANHVNEGICTDQPSIRAELVVDAPDDAQVIWKVEALEGPSRKDDTKSSSDTKKKTMYGKTKTQQISKFGGNSSSVWNNASGTGTGEFGTPFIATSRLLKDNKYFKFSPDMSDESHEPSIYASGSCSGQYSYCDRGTNMTDVWRHNPHVAYKVTAIVNGVEYEAIAKMDHIDALRQEYINHIYSTLNHSGGDARLPIKSVTVPERDAFIAIPDSGLWVENNLTGDNAWLNYEYSVIVDVSMRTMLGQLQTIISQNVTTTYETDNGTEVEWPEGAYVEVTSGFRNPERNERVGGASGSRHMLGRALDLAVHGITTDAEKEIAYFILWKMLKEKRPPTVDLMQLEDDPADWIIKYNFANPSQTTDTDWDSSDLDENDISDGYSDVKHIHLQDNP